MSQLVCSTCRATYPLNDVRWKCDCGGALDIEFAPLFDRKQIKSRKPTMWRYREALPLDSDANIVSLGEGFTPLVEMDFDGRTVLIKQDQLFPTGSYKDRGAALLISKVKELGVQRVVEDSSGNAGCAVAAYCARAGVACEIFVPEDTAAAKLAQITAYGATLKKVPGSREDTARAALRAAAGRYYASHSWNPFFFHGTKTFAFEVCEQLGWKSPGTVIVPVGNGTLLLGCAIGFRELLGAGVIDRMPKLVGVQSANCAPLHRAFKDGADAVPHIEKTPTIAEGIAIAEPARGMQVVEAVRRSGGEFVIVDDAEIEAALKDTCGKGFYIEPTSAATIAGVKKHVAGSNDGDTVLSVFTGHGLKAAEKVVKLLG